MTDVASSFRISCGVACFSKASSFMFMPGATVGSGFFCFTAVHLNRRVRLMLEFMRRVSLASGKAAIPEADYNVVMRLRPSLFDAYSA